MSSLAPPPLQGLAARTLGAADITALRALRAEVGAALPDPDLYVPEDDEAGFIAEHLGPRGQTIGLFADEAGGVQLVAYAMLGLPGGAPHAVDRHLGRSLGWTHGDCARTAELASCMVVPRWRGRGLQRALVASRLLLARAHGMARVLAIVSLHNHGSRHNLMACGLHVEHTGHWQGLQRQWMLLDLQAGPAQARAPHRPAQWLRGDDFAAQCAAAARAQLGVLERRVPGRAPWIGYAVNPLHAPAP